MPFDFFSRLLGGDGGAKYVERPASDMPAATATNTNSANTVNLAQASNPAPAQAQPAPAAAHNHSADSTPSSEAANVNKGIADYLRNFITRRDGEYSGHVKIAESKRGADFSKSNEGRDGSKYAPYEVFRDIASVRESILEKRIQETIKVNRWLTSDGKVIPPDERWVKSQEHKIYNDLDNAVAAEVKRRHYARDSSKGISPEILDKELNLAFKAVENEVPSKGGLLNTIIKPFYDESGVKLGGIGGAGLGLLMASMLIPDTSWLGNLAKVLFVFLGAYAGNKFVDSLPSSNRFASLSTEGVKQAEKSQGLEQQQKIDSHPAQNKITDVNLNGANITKVDGGTTVDIDKPLPKPQLFAVAEQPVVQVNPHGR